MTKIMQHRLNISWKGVLNPTSELAIFVHLNKHDYHKKTHDKIWAEYILSTTPITISLP